jgi:hypothetical protein
MVQLIRPSEVRVQTHQGECQVTIVLELNINLTTDGASIGHKVREAPPKEDNDKVEWAIPDFIPSKKINFGKTED